MQFLGSVVVLAIIVSLVNRIASQKSPQGECNVFGDPHLTMFPIDPAQAGLRMMYWCRSPGRMLILKNKYIEFYVDVSPAPFWNENFEIKMLAGPQILCTITNTNPSCNSALVDVQNSGSGLDVLYYDADFLSVIINSHLIGNRNVYNIIITQSYHITLESSGLCVTKSPTCRLENSLIGKRPKRNLDRNNATKLCDIYMKQAYRVVQETLNNTGSAMTEHARAACINDVSTTGDSAWGQSAVSYVVMDALKQSSPKALQRREKLKMAISAIATAVSRAKDMIADMGRPTRPDLVHE